MIGGSGVVLSPWLIISHHWGKILLNTLPNVQWITRVSSLTGGNRVLFPKLGKLKLLCCNPFRWFISKPQVVFHILSLISTLMNTCGIPLQISRVHSLCSSIISTLCLMNSSYLVLPGLLGLSPLLREPAKLYPGFSFLLCDLETPSRQ